METLNKDPQLQRSTDNLISGTGTETTLRASTLTGHNSSTEVGSSNGPTATIVHEDAHALDLRNEIKNLMIQKQERPRSPEATSASQAKTSQTTRVLHSAGENLLKAQAETAASVPTLAQPTRSTPPFAAPLSPNDLRAEIQSISKQTVSARQTSPSLEPSPRLAEPLPLNDLRSEIQSITRQKREKGPTFSLSSKDVAKDTTMGVKSDNRTVGRGWDRYRPKYGSRSRSRSRSRTRRRSWSRLRIRSRSRSPNYNYRSSRRRSRSRSRGRPRQRMRSDSRGRSRKRWSRSRSRNRTRSGSRTRSYKRQRVASRGRSSSPKARRTDPTPSTSTIQSSPQKTTSKQATAPTKAPSTLFLRSSEVATPLVLPNASAPDTTLLPPKSEPKATPRPVQENTPVQAKLMEQQATTPNVPGIQPHSDVSMPLGESTPGNDAPLSRPSLVPLNPATPLKKSPSIQELTMNDGDSDVEIVKMEPKDDSFIILPDDLKSARRKRRAEINSSGRGKKSSSLRVMSRRQVFFETSTLIMFSLSLAQLDTIFDLSQGGTRYFLMRCSSLKDILEAQKTVNPFNVGEYFFEG